MKKEEFSLEESLNRAKGPGFKSFQKSLLAWYDKVKAPHPWRLFWDKERNPYHVWVSEIMLQQTLIRVVTPLYIKFIERFPRVEDLAKAKEEELRLYVKGLGYYSRFDRLHRAAKLLTEGEKDFEWPQTFSEWKALPGIGDYTASAISSIAFGEVKAVVDGNVERVFSRLFSIHDIINAPKMKKDLQKLSDQIVSKKRPGDYNQALMELGQTHCSKGEPACLLCPVNQSCLAYKQGVQNQLPYVLKQKKPIDVDLYAFVIRKRGKVFLSKREVQSPFLKNRPGFPLSKVFKKKVTEKNLLGTYKHSITHHKLKVHVLEETKISKKIEEDGLWVSEKKLEETLMTSLDLKAMKFLRN